MFPATLFDYNGVLVDDEAVHLAAFRDVLGPLGVDLSERDYWERYLGFDDAGAFRAILMDSGRAPSSDDVRGLVEAKAPRYLARATGALRAFPGARELVRRRALAGPVVIVSGALRGEIELGLSVLGVEDCVLGIVSAEDTLESKPDPEGYSKGKECLTGLAGADVAGRAVVIEDSTAGVLAAKGAGLVCVAVAHSYSEEVLIRAGADLAVPDLAAIDDFRLSDLYRRTTR